MSKLQKQVAMNRVVVCEVLMMMSAGWFQVLVWKEIGYSQLSEAAKQMLVLEVNLLRELRHDNIVRYYDRIVDKSRSVLFIIMEYCEGGDLASYIKKIKASQYVSTNFLKIVIKNCLRFTNGLNFNLISW